MVSTMALLNSTVLTHTRMPFALAEDGYLPSFLTKSTHATAQPVVAILISAALRFARATYTRPVSASTSGSVARHHRDDRTLRLGLRHKRPDMPVPSVSQPTPRTRVRSSSLPDSDDRNRPIFQRPIAKRWAHGPWPSAQCLRSGEMVHEASREASPTVEKRRDASQPQQRFSSSDPSQLRKPRAA